MKLPITLYSVLWNHEEETSILGIYTTIDFANEAIELAKLDDQDESNNDDGEYICEYRIEPVRLEK